MLKRIRSIAVLAAVALVATCESAFNAAVSAAYCAAHKLRAWAGDFLVSVLCGPQPIASGAELRAGTREKVKARQFVARTEKRERPTITGSWRMCPSC